jgi:hypothetical protein
VWSDTYSLVTSSFGVVWDLADPVLAPHKWMVVVRLELAGNKLCPRVKCLQILLVERGCEVALDRGQCCIPDVVANNAD